MGSARPHARVLRWVEGVLLAAGAVALAWSAFVVVEARLSQRRARQWLESMPRAAASTSVRGTVATGAPLAELLIPGVQLSAMVLHGSDARTLQLGLGHIENTAWPGESGNVGIAGHRDSFFRPLRNVHIGDDILLNTPEEQLHYRVSSLRVVQSTDVSILEPTDDATLTLVTCFPFWFFGNAPDRFVVRATRVADRPTRAFAGPPSWPPDWNRAAGAAGARTDEPSRSGDDDVALIKQAIERFRLTYNARLVKHHEIVPGRPLTLQACDVTAGVDAATAICQIDAEPPDDPESPVWAFTLWKTREGWVIKSIATE